MAGRLISHKSINIVGLHHFGKDCERIDGTGSTLVGDCTQVWECLGVNGRSLVYINRERCFIYDLSVSPIKTDVRIIYLFCHQAFPIDLTFAHFVSTMKVQQALALLAFQAIGGVFSAPVATPGGKNAQKHFPNNYHQN